MARWKAQPIYIWFHDKYDTNEENCLPYNPNHFYAHIQGNNEEIDMLQGSVTIQKSPKLVEYDTIESFFAHPDIYRIMRSKNGYDWTPSKWESFFRDAMNKKKVLELTITGKNWVDEVTVEDFQYGPKAGVEKDSQFTLRIKQFRKAKIKKENIVIERNYPQTGNTNTQYSGNTIPAKTSIGANVWLDGPAFLNKGSHCLENKYTLSNGYAADFSFMPIEIVQKDLVGNSKLNLTDVSNAIINECKTRAYQGGTVNGLISYDTFQTSIKAVWGKYPQLATDAGNLSDLLWSYYKTIFGVNLGNDYTNFTQPQIYTFFKSLLNNNDFATFKYMQKNGIISDSDSLTILKFGNEYRDKIKKLSASYTKLDAPDKAVACVKFLEDVKFENIYDPISSKWQEDIIIKKNDKTFWVYEENIKKENKPYKEFELQWSK